MVDVSNKESDCHICNVNIIDCDGIENVIIIESNLDSSSVNISCCAITISEVRLININSNVQVKVIVTK